MAHFAEIDATNNVVRVLVAPDEHEHRGQEFLADDLALGGTWIQTSYWSRGGVHYGEDNEPDGGTAVRFNYAGAGYTYDPDADAFHSPSPHLSWSLDENFFWQPPTPKPDDGNPYDWDEDTTSWVEVEVPG